MFWIILAITSHFFWAIANVGDRYVLLNRIKNPYFYLFWLAVPGILLVVFLPFLHLPWPSISMLAALALATVFYFFGGLPYVWSMQVEEVTRVNILWSFLPILTLLGGWFTIGDKLNGTQLVALVVLFLGALIASLKRGAGQTLTFSKVIWPMLAACLSFAVYALIIRYVTQTVPPATVFVWRAIMAAVLAPSLFLSKKFRQDFHRELKGFYPAVFWLTFLFSALEGAGMFFNIWALALGPASLVLSFEGAQLLFVFALSILITRKNPRLLQEDLGRKNLVCKLTALALIIAGIIILNNS